MRFWDSSAIAPLVVAEPTSDARRKQVAEEPLIVVWYGTIAELESALCRRVREGNLSQEAAATARRRLSWLSEAWVEVEPTSRVRSRAIRLLRIHPLRAADAFQLAAALIAVEERPEGATFVTGDLGLAAAAEAEGFSVIQ